MSTAEALFEKLNRHPILKARIEELLKLVEDADIEKASQAEQRVIEELRQMGNEVLNDWAVERVKKTKRPKEAKANGKKNSVGTLPLEK